jgi:hypothetical protein
MFDGDFPKPAWDIAGFIGAISSNPNTIKTIRSGENWFYPDFK